MKYQPDLGAALDTLHPRFRRAVTLAAAQLRLKDVPAALVGGLAVGAYGHIRNTKDVDFIVLPEAAFEGSGLVISLREGMPLKADGVTIDLLPAEEKWLLRALRDATIDETGIPVIGAQALIAMKLLAWRPRDQSDVIGLLEAGVERADVEVYLQRNGLGRELDRLTRLLARAEEG